MIPTPIGTARSRLARFCAVLATLCVLLGACGTSADDAVEGVAIEAASAETTVSADSTTTIEPTTTTEPTTTIEPDRAPAVSAETTALATTTAPTAAPSTTAAPETSETTAPAAPTTTMTTAPTSTTTAPGPTSSSSAPSSSAPSSSTTTTAAPETSETTAPAVAASLPAPGPVARAASPRCVAELSVDQLAAHTIAALFTQSRSNAAAELVASEVVGSLVLLGNPTDAARLTADLSRIEDASPGPDPLFMVDEEGGRVQRLSRILDRLPSASVQSGLSSDELSALWQSHARSMTALGFDIGLAPVVDIGAGVGIGTRSFGPTTDAVTQSAASAIAGMTAGGITPTLKHFPGHGGTDTDSHIDLPVTAPFDELDLDTYRTLLAENTTVMVGHLSVPGLTEPGVPTSLTAATYDVLRNDLGFDGVIMTDALNMGAVVKTSSEPAVGALLAGADIVMVDLTEAVASHARIVDAVESGKLPIERLEAAAERVLRLKSSCG